MKLSKIIAVILVAFVSLASGSALKIHNLVQPDASNIRENINYDEVSGSINLMIVGIDDVEGIHRSDTIALATIDIDNKIVRLMSIPRDTRVQIPGHGWQKINHAYAYGKEQLLQESLINYLGIPLNYFIIVNYKSFPEIVDLLGGVDINVAKRLSYHDKAGNLHINIPKGLQHLDGNSALGYVRFRNDALGDIGRVQRQQKFLKAILNKAQDPSMISQLPKLAKQLLKLVKSDLSPSQAIQLASYLSDIPRENMMFFTLPGKAAYISNVSYWIGDLTEASQMLSSMPGDLPRTVNSSTSEKPEEKEEILPLERILTSIRTPVAVLNGDGTSGIGKRAADYLQKMGIDVAYIGNAKHFDYKYSNILYPTASDMDKRSSAIALAQIADIPKTLVREDDNVPYATIILGHNYSLLLKRFETLNNQM